MPEHLNELSLSALRAPINGGCGEDLSFSALFDQIKEARRADADYLSQGDWQQACKKADWAQVIELAANGLTEHSKDLMLVGWLIEGLAHTYHFVGVSFGLTLAQAVLSEHWEGLFPSLADGLEQRATRLDWLNTALAEVVGSLPITDGQKYGLLQYEESREVENKVRQNPDYKGIAQAEGKVDAELFLRSLVLTDTENLRRRHAEISECLSQCRQLHELTDQLFVEDAPGFVDLEARLKRACRLVEQLLEERGIEIKEAPVVCAEPVANNALVNKKTVSLPLSNQPMTRDGAFVLLADIAQFFKANEPHSPVPYLIERAIKWGHMPLENWLHDVIKDGKVVNGVCEVLGTAHSASEGAHS